MVIANLSTEDNPTISKVLSVAGDTFSMEVGSTIGGLFGQALSEASKSLEGMKVLDAAGLSAMLGTMLKTISRVGGAELGDKTLIDALEPAAHAAEASARAGHTFGEALAKAAWVATAGSRETSQMMAKKGRSSYLGERSRGREDPGAAFIAYFLTAMSQSSHNWRNKRVR
jgi:phosphoenolpyruvate---glycerone phosphotransferase subunit DhaL